MTIETEAARQIDIRQVVAGDTVLRRAASTGGGEYEGACPFCGGRDRFRVWPASGRYWCRRCRRKGDVIQYMRDRYDLGYGEALAVLGQLEGRRARPEPVPDQENGLLEPPSGDWQVRGFTIMFECQQALWDPGGARALAWLRGRGLAEETILRARLGYNAEDRYEARPLWGLPADAPDQKAPKRLWLPRGIVIPWAIDEQLWRLNIRRPLSARQIAGGLPKYIAVAGGSNALYNAAAVRPGRAVVLLEGELDARIVEQEAGDLVAAVATGSTAGARRIPWLAVLAQAAAVLVAFDNDDAGEGASRYWLDALPNARRWRPYWGDASDMAQDGGDVRGWVRTGLAQ